MNTAAALRFGLDPLKLRGRPYLHTDPATWEVQCEEFASHPTEALSLCHYDMRPGPERLPRANTAIVEAAAFMAAVTAETGDKEFLRTHLDMLLPTRGLPAVSLARGQYLAAVAWCFDILFDTLDEPALGALRRTLVEQAGRTADELAQRAGGPWPLEDPDLVASWAGLVLAGLAVLHEEPDAPAWIDLANPCLELVLAHVARDGWWPTGFEDWNALLPLLTRVADAWQRLGGVDRFDCGLFSEAWRVAIHGLAPTGVDVLELDHVGRPDLPRRRAELGGRAGAHYRWRNEPCRWVLHRLAQRFEEPGLRAALQQWRTAALGRGTPWEALWARPEKSRRGSHGRPHHTFAAHGLGVWRDGWDAAALCVALATGPAYGARDAALADIWQPATPLDADANQLLLWAGGESLLVDSGTLPDGPSLFHNTVLVDGHGQLPPQARQDQGARLESAWLSDLGGLLVGQAGGVFPAAAGVETFDRHVAFAPGYVVVWDDLATRRPARFDWLLHTGGSVEIVDGSRARLTSRRVSLHVQALRPDRLSLAAEEARVEPDAEPLALRLRLRSTTPVTRTQFLIVLAPARGEAESPPQARLITDQSTVGAKLTWANGDTEDVLFPIPERGVVLPDLIADAAYLAFRRQPDGDWHRLLARRVTRLLMSGGEVLTATQPVDVALAADGVELRGEIETATGATVTLRCPFGPRGVVVDGESGRARLERDSRLVAIRLTAGRHQVWVSGR